MFIEVNVSHNNLVCGVCFLDNIIHVFHNLKSDFVLIPKRGHSEIVNVYLIFQVRTDFSFK